MGVWRERGTGNVLATVASEKRFYLADWEREAGRGKGEGGGAFRMSVRGGGWLPARDVGQVQALSLSIRGRSPSPAYFPSTGILPCMTS